MKAEQELEFAKGICLEEDFDEHIKYLNKQSQERLNLTCKNVIQSYGDNRRKFLLTDYPLIGFPNDMYYSYAHEGNKEEKLIDDGTKEYLQMILDEMRNKNKRRNDK